MGSLQDDIIKYKKGELSAKEMHALEKKALSDPFLAEALEGIENISSDELSEDVLELNRKILKEKRTILLTPLRIAAGVILVAASVFLFYQLSPKQETIALKTEKPSAQSPTPRTEPQKTEEKKEPKQNEFSTRSSQQTGEKLKSKERKKVVAPKVPLENRDVTGNQLAEVAKPKIEVHPIIAERKEIAGPEKKQEELKVAVQQKAPMSIAMEPIQKLEDKGDLKEETRAVRKSKDAKVKSEALSGAGLAQVSAASKPISGKVISEENGEPLPGVNVVVEGTTIGTVTDADGNFSLKTTNENQLLVVSFIGLETQEVNIEGKDKIDIKLKSDVTQLSEVVVTGYGVARDNDEEPIIHLAEPLGGKRAYNKYLDNNVRYPEEASKNNIKGKVKVEFAVRIDGSLDEYKVVKGLGYGCDEEVIRLIKEGPKWSPSTENGQPIESTVLVGVKFGPAKAGR